MVVLERNKGPCITFKKLFNERHYALRNHIKENDHAIIMKSWVDMGVLDKKGKLCLCIIIVGE